MAPLIPAIRSHNSSNYNNIHFHQTASRDRDSRMDFRCDAGESFAGDGNVTQETVFGRTWAEFNFSRILLDT